MTPSTPEASRAAGCRLLAAAALLAAVLILFQLPLRGLFAKVAAGGNPVAGFFGPSKGFLARVGSQPPGAKVLIDGKVRGETPFLGNVACTQGQKIQLEIKAEGYAPWRREIDCREDGQLGVDAQLSR